MAEVGEALGYKIWIGKKEQSETAGGILGGVKKLKEYVTSSISKLVDINDPETVEMIDLLWIKGSKVIAAFEIESTTTMTSGLVRGSNLSTDVQKYLVIPEEREDQLNRKMKSPMFADHFKVDNWQVLYFDTLRTNYKKLKTGEIALDDLAGQKLKTVGVKEADANYNLFLGND